MKTLEKKYSRTERVVAKGRFSALNYFKTVLIALILGGITAVVWAFKDKIEAVFTKSEPAVYLTDEVMRYVLLAVAIVVVISFVIESIRYGSKELVLTPDKLAYREGVFSIHSTTVQLSEIKMVETKQNVFQRMLGFGTLLIVSDAQQPYEVKNVRSPERLSRKIMQQASRNRRAGRPVGVQPNVRFSGYMR